MDLFILLMGPVTEARLWWPPCHLHQRSPLRSLNQVVKRIECLLRVCGSWGRRENWEVAKNSLWKSLRAVVKI